MDLDLKVEEKRKPGDVEPPKRKLKIIERIRNFFANPRKRLIFIGAVGLLVIAAFGLGLYFMTHEGKSSGDSTKKAADVEEQLFEAPLDGVKTDIDSSNRYPLAIMVENHTEARPQSGLEKASVIYEAIAEGGITRFMALFGTHEAEKVGPVRSARPYFVDWAHGYNAYYAHVGGNALALDKISSEKILDLDQFKYASLYWRDNSKIVSSEHTVYTSTIKLREKSTELGYTISKNFNIYRFKDDPDPTSTSDTTAVATPITAATVDIDFSSANYKVQYKYDKTTNSYKRYLAGLAHNDAISGNQLNPKNVIVMTVKRTPIVTRINEHGYEMDNIGEGVAKIFINGKVIDGKWKKSSKESREIFYDLTGQEITFNRGQFWISVIPPEGTVTATAEATTSN
jgi:hypothetical protein